MGALRWASAVRVGLMSALSDIWMWVIEWFLMALIEIASIALLMVWPLGRKTCMEVLGLMWLQLMGLRGKLVTMAWCLLVIIWVTRRLPGRKAFVRVVRLVTQLLVMVPQATCLDVFLTLQVGAVVGPRLPLRLRRRARSASANSPRLVAMWLFLSMNILSMMLLQLELMTAIGVLTRVDASVVRRRCRPNSRARLSLRVSMVSMLF